MYEYVALRVNCPLCGKSLMDPKTLVDNISGVRLDISFDDQKGKIYLSSIYGSYHYVTRIKIPPGQEALFSCPHCKKSIASEYKCKLCSAPMIPLKIEVGGTVRFCSRAGCKKHSIEFENLPQALEHFYNTFDYGDQNIKESEEIEDEAVQVTSDKEIIRSGAFLRTYCPHCDESLLEKNSVILKVKLGGEEGLLKLSPYLNVFTNESTIFVTEGAEVDEVQCPHCDKSLIIPKQSCPKCKSRIVGISVAAASKLIEFYFCAKKGCYWHGLSNDDINDIILEESCEW